MHRFRLGNERAGPAGYGTWLPPAGAPQAGLPQTDLPQTDLPQTDLPQTDLPQTDLPQTDFPQTDLPQTDFPQTDLPQTENRTQLNKEEQSKDKQEKEEQSKDQPIPPNPPGGRTGPGPGRRDRHSGLEWETNGRVRPAMGLDFPMPEHLRGYAACEPSLRPCKAPPGVREGKSLPPPERGSEGPWVAHMANVSS